MLFLRIHNSAKLSRSITRKNTALNQPEISRQVPRFRNLDTMASYLITGCSRGLGLALAERLLSFPVSEVATIIATSRTESATLKELVAKSEGRVIFTPLDTTMESSIKNAVTETTKTLGGKGLDVLINNAGTCSYVQGGITAM